MFRKCIQTSTQWFEHTHQNVLVLYIIYTQFILLLAQTMSQWLAIFFESLNSNKHINKNYQYQYSVNVHSSWQNARLSSVFTIQIQLSVECRGVHPLLSPVKKCDFHSPEGVHHNCAKRFLRWAHGWKLMCLSVCLCVCVSVCLLFWWFLRPAFDARTHQYIPRYFDKILCPEIRGPKKSMQKLRFVRCITHRAVPFFGPRFGPLFALFSKKVRSCK